MDFSPQILDLINSHDHKLNTQKPSEWTEENRVMGSSTTSFPGRFSYDRTPYLREPIDCLSVDSDARVIAVMKGAQIGFSTGVIESGIAWIISQQPGNIMLLARDEALVKTMMENKIDPLIDGTGIRHLIKPNVIRKRNQRTGDTAKGKEFAGGMLMAGSVQTPGRMRQVSIQYGFIDDFEAAPRADKDAGSTTKLIETRFASYYKKMKLYYISTPEMQQSSNIEPVYELGDKRRYCVPCPCCGDFIPLEWEIDLEGKEKAGITWKVDNLGKLIEDSVGYICQSCGDFFTDKSKYEMNLAGVWTPTQEPSEPGYRSYHISSLYAPPGMYDWKHYVRDWIKIHPIGGDVQIAEKKTFFNTCLGLTWVDDGESPEAKNLAKNARPYKVGIVPNKLSIDDGNGEIVLLTCACDLNGKIDDARLDFEVVAWSVSGASYSVIHGSIGTFVPLENQKKNKDENREKWTYRETGAKSVWNEFKNIVEAEYFKDDSSGSMKIFISGVDTGFFTQYAYSFLERCNPPMMFGLKGKDVDKFKRFDANQQVFQLSKERSDMFLLNVNKIKDDIAAYMKMKWNGAEEDAQPYGFMNFPEASGGLYSWNGFYSHFEGEHRIIEKNKEGDSVSARWVKKTSASQNHLFDCRIYNIALKEILTHLICKEYKEPYPDWRKYCKIIGVI